MNANQDKKLWEIIGKRPFDRQLEQAVEEASEFILAAQKLKRYPQDSNRWEDLREESGDLLIMMEQMRGYLGVELVDQSMDFKPDRELERIEEERK